MGLDPPPRDGRDGLLRAARVRTQVHGRAELPDADGDLRHGHLQGQALVPHTNHLDLPVTRFRKFVALPTSDRRLLLRAALWLGLVRASLWVLPFQNLLDRPMSPGPGRESSPPALGAADRIRWAA